MVELETVRPGLELATKLPTHQISKDDEVVDLCKQLGLTTQGNLREYSYLKEELKHLKLSEEEGVIWSVFCPRSYESHGSPRVSSTGVANGFSVSTIGFGVPRDYYLSDYQFDLIPVEVLRLWTSLKKRYTALEFSIRTTEETEYSDPLLIGTFDKDKYLLARWGDESPGLLSFRQVCEKVVGTNNWVGQWVRRIYPDIQDKLQVTKMTGNKFVTMSPDGWVDGVKISGGYVENPLSPPGSLLSRLFKG